MIENLIKIYNSIQNSGNLEIPEISKHEEYFKKIMKFATILPYIDQETTKGFIAYYKNDPKKENAFLSLIAVDPNFQGMGLGRKLLEFSLIDVKNEGFKRYSLEVLKKNKRAVSMYDSFGFFIAEDRGDLWLMTINL